MKQLSKKYKKEISNTNPIKPKKETFDKAIKHINKNIDKSKINLEKLASKAGYSKYHFLREFKKEFGLTPCHYIHNIKINQARNLIDSNNSLSQIAFECGFADQSHFIKIYKKFYGHTPSKIK